MSPLALALGFVSTYKRLPSAALNRPEWERSIAAWMRTQDKVHPDLVYALNHHMPGWRNTYQTWYDNAESTSDHRTQMSSWPSQSSYDPDEVKLAQWLTFQRARYHRKDYAMRIATPTRPHEARFMDEIAPGWSKMADHDETFARQVDELARWVADNGGTLPRERAEDRHEHTLAKRLSYWQSAAAGRNGRSAGGFTRERVELLEKKVPGALTPKKRRNDLVLRDNEWNATAQEAIAFVRKHRAFPYRRSFNRAERRLGWWVYEQRNALDRQDPVLTPEREETLDANLKGWRDYMRRGADGRPSTTVQVGIVLGPED